MEAFIITTAVAKRFRAHKIVARYGFKPTYCCTNEKRRKALLRLGIPSKSIVVMSIPEDTGIYETVLARHFVAKHLMQRNVWSIWLDDNVTALTGLKPSISENKLDFSDLKARERKVWRRSFEHVLKNHELQEHIETMIHRAEEANTIYCGCATSPNYYFRANKWQDFGYCRTNFALYKNDDSTWNPANVDPNTIEDLVKSVDVVARYGQVVVNRHIHVVKPQFESGGIGDFKFRLPWLRACCKSLMEAYPGLLKYSKGSTQYGVYADKYHVQFAKRSRATVDAWRREHGYLDE